MIMLQATLSSADLIWPYSLFMYPFIEVCIYLKPPQIQKKPYWPTCDLCLNFGWKPFPNYSNLKFIHLLRQFFSKDMLWWWRTCYDRWIVVSLFHSGISHSTPRHCTNVVQVTTCGTPRVDLVPPKHMSKTGSVSRMDPSNGPNTNSPSSLSNNWTTLIEKWIFAIIEHTRLLTSVDRSWSILSNHAA